MSTAVNSGDVTEVTLRARASLEGWGGAVALLLCVLAVTGGWATYTAHVAPGTETIERTETVWTGTGTFDYAATVTKSNPVFPVGAELEGRTQYYTGVAPELGGSFSYRYAAPSGEATVRATTSLVYRSVGENGEVYWTQREELAARTATVPPGEGMEVPFAVNVSTLQDRVAETRAGLGAELGTVEAFVLANVTKTGTIGGEPVERTLQYQLGVGTGGGTYTVSPPETTRTTGDPSVNWFLRPLERDSPEDQLYGSGRSRS